MQKQLSILLLVLCLSSILKAQEGYFVTFTDKNNTPYSIDKPSEFLSQRAIERRTKQAISITEQDLPVNPEYIDSLKKADIDVRHSSKWFNAVIVFSGNTTLMDTLDRVSFIHSVEKTKPAASAPSQINKFEESFPKLKSSNTDIYGDAWDQIRTINGHLLHQQGYTGKGMHIAVIDAGFKSVDNLPLFQHLWDNDQILGTKDFVNPLSNIFAEDTHGMNVLSIIGGEMPNEYTGTAPDANFWLLRTEDAYSETPIEPDYWICAAEFADSAGVDIINTSLGYYEFDVPTLSYTRLDMDGSTRISQASEIAAAKGMVLVTSAGNEGNNYWHYIAAPADARNILSVGAIAADSTKASFSSYGPTFDGRIKPEVSAMGVSIAVQNTTGGISRGNGTSFSAPVIAGMVACLWQAYPGKTASEIREIVISSANQSNIPDNELGYGIPNFELAYKTDITSTNETDENWAVSPNPFTKHLTISNHLYPANGVISISMYDIIGNLILRKTYAYQNQIILDEVSAFANGIYILIIENNHFKQHVKVIKSY